MPDVTRLPFSPVPLAAGAAGLLGVVYIGLMAIVMTYGALTIEFTEQVKTDNAQVATLEAEYLGDIAAVTDTDYASAGYAVPTSVVYVPRVPATALR